MEIKKENWKGKKLTQKLIIIPLIILYTFLLMGPELLIVAPVVSIGILIALVIWILLIIIYSQNHQLQIMRKKRGCKVLVGDYTKGKDTDEYEWPIKDIYALSNAREYTQESITYSQLHLLKQETWNKELGLMTKAKGKLIPMDQIEDLLSYFEQERIDTDISDIELQTDFISDKISERLYELETKQEPIELIENKNQQTKKYRDWRNQNSRMETIIQKEVRTQLKLLPEKKTQEALKSSRIKNIAINIARQFPLSEIESAKTDGAEGAAIQGYLQRYNDHKELIQKEFVLDKAAEIAKRFEIPIIYGIIDHVDLNACFRTIIVLDKPQYFKKEPNLPFDQVLIYSDRPFITAVTWKENQLMEVDDYPNISMTRGKANLNILTRAEFNTPMAHLAHAPGKGYSIKGKLEYESKEIEEEAMKYRKEIIENLENKLRDQEDRADHFAKRFRTEQKISTNATVKLELLQEKKGQRDIDKITKEYHKENNPITKNQKIYIGIIIGLCILSCFLLFAIL